MLSIWASLTFCYFVKRYPPLFPNSYNKWNMDPAPCKWGLLLQTNAFGECNTIQSAYTLNQSKILLSGNGLKSKCLLQINKYAVAIWRGWYHESQRCIKQPLAGAWLIWKCNILIFQHLNKIQYKWNLLLCYLRI